MKNLYLTVEGQTEEAFAVMVLQPHLAEHGVHVSAPRFTGPHGRRKGKIPRGGMFNRFRHVLEDLRRWLMENHSPDARFSMMIDLYHLPNDFPGQDKAQGLKDCYQRAAALEEALAAELGDLGGRFIPYLQVHEFEALVLSDPGRFGGLFKSSSGAPRKLSEECARFDGPERINHGQHSHPKARIQKHFPDYDENIDGPLLASDIGLPVIRERCPHFGAWLARLEALDRRPG